MSEARKSSIEGTSENSAPSERHVIINRTFNAPRDLVFKVWTDPEHLKHWWGPKSFTITHSKVELKPGGMFHYCMRSADGKDMWGKFVYREIDPPKRLVYVNSFSDEHGGTTPNPWMPTWPLETLNEMTFTEEGGKTTVTIEGMPLNASAEQKQLFVSALDSMRKGFTGTFQQLDAHLAKIQA